jgi:murein DD-endopeptidase MepM/ murein hydrolase activator NlpD
MARTAVTVATVLVLAWAAAVGGGGEGEGADEQRTARVGASAVQQPEPPPSDDVPPERPPAPPGAGVPAPGARYAWPLLPPPGVLGPFREPAHAFAPGHRGVDLAGVAGQPVLAARGGSVVFAGPVGGRSVVSVQHDDGLRTTYEPVRPLVTAGAVVRAGDVIAVLEPGHPSCAPATCLHWGVRRDRNVYVDPLVLLRPPRVRLLPVPDPWPSRLP